MKREPLLSKDIPSKVLTAIKQMRKACTHTVTHDVLNYDEYGQALRQLREDADISLNDMARRIGRSPAFVSDCELGRRRFNLADQIKFITECKP